MPRRARENSISNVYHIIFRGNDKQDIFYDNQDRYVFLDRIKETKKKFNYEVYAYCLMDNHVHMVIRVKDDYIKKKDSIVNRRVLLHYFNNNVEELKKFSLINDDKEKILEIAEYEIIKRLSEDELSNIIKRRYNLQNASDVSLLEKQEINLIIKELRKVQGTSINQIARVTKVTRHYIQKL